MWQSPLRKLRCFVILSIQVNADNCLIVKWANILSSGLQRNNKTIIRSQKPVKTHKQNTLGKTKKQSTLSDGKILEISGCFWLDEKLCELTNKLLLLCNSTKQILLKAKCGWRAVLVWWWGTDHYVHSLNMNEQWQFGDIRLYDESL